MNYPSTQSFEVAIPYKIALNISLTPFDVELFLSNVYLLNCKYEGKVALAIRIHVDYQAIGIADWAYIGEPHQHKHYNSFKMDDEEDDEYFAINTTCDCMLRILNDHFKNLEKN